MTKLTHVAQQLADGGVQVEKRKAGLLPRRRFLALTHPDGRVLDISYAVSDSAEMPLEQALSALVRSIAFVRGKTYEQWFEATAILYDRKERERSIRRTGSWEHDARFREVYEGFVRLARNAQDFFGAAVFQALTEHAEDDVAWSGVDA